MVPGAPLEGMVLTHEPLHDIEVTQCIKDATEAVSCSRDVATSGDLEFIFPIPGHPTMRPNMSFI
jgi:hypothetical protein